MLTGHLGTDYLGAAGVGNIWMIVTSNFIFNALGGTINTLCSQAFGAKNYDLVGVWFQVRLWCV